MQDRKFLSHLILSAMLILGSGQAFSQADSYPARTITMIVPTAPGGTTDISARMLATPLGAALGQTIVVENKGGGNGNIAASQVKRAPPDGYMIMII
jgi:tripartite-type tricarboxylate transporter receptor subunit TctC